jgi:hypothetical protein
VTAKWRRAGDVGGIKWIISKLCAVTDEELYVRVKCFWMSWIPTWITLLRVAVAGRSLSGSSSCICNQVTVHCFLRFYCFSRCRGPVITGRVCAGLCRSSGIDVYLAGARFEYRQGCHVYGHAFHGLHKCLRQSRDCAWIRQRPRPLLSKSSPVYPHFCTTNAK